jgi:hypothetical protein
MNDISSVTTLSHLRLNISNKINRRRVWRYQRECTFYWGKKLPGLFLSLNVSKINTYKPFDKGNDT